MERHEIIEAFNEWSIPVSLHNLENPTSDFVTAIYSACLQRVRSLTEADLELPLQAALSKVENSVSFHPTSHTSKFNCSPQELYASALAHSFLFHHL